MCEMIVSVSSEIWKYVVRVIIDHVNLPQSFKENQSILSDIRKVTWHTEIPRGLMETRSHRWTLDVVFFQTLASFSLHI